MASSVLCSVTRLESMFDQIIENSEICPILRLESDGVPIRVSEDTAAFRWFRCEYTMTADANQHRVCALEYCGKPAGIQCMFCRVREDLLDQSYFCSTDCFANSWEDHRLLHDPSIPPTIKVPRGTSDILNHWKEVGRTLEYLPGKADVGKTLKLEVTPLNISGSSGKPVILEFPVVLQAFTPPPERRWLNLQNNDDIRRPKVTFRILTFNVLADLYATREAYPYCPAWALPWNYRKRLILRDILQSKADVFALQEVQGDHFKNFLEPELRKVGYEGVYKQKTRESMGEEGKMDGCAIFYRADRFVLEEKHALEFNHVAMSRSKLLKTQAALQCLLKDNVALVVVLAMHGGMGRVCVATTHIFCNTEFNNVKMWQVNTLVRELEKFALPRGLPLVIAGDFNSTPDSAVYEFLSEAEIPVGHEELYQDDVGILESVELKHNLDLQDAYSSIQDRYLTNHTASFSGVIDYIWYTADRLRAVQILAPIDLSSQTPFPNPTHSSDHIAIAAEIEILTH